LPPSFAAGNLRIILIGQGGDRVLLKLQTLVVYDVEHTRVRTRMANACLDYGLERIQLSAFRGPLTSTERKELFLKLKELLKGSTGRLLLAPLCENDWEKTLAFEYPSGRFVSQKAPRPRILRLPP
jgi:CRISPR-associated protein Cas2